MALQASRDIDKSEPFHSYKVALQETSYDKDKEEFCCAVVVDSYSFIKRLPFASCFHLALTTLVSIAACYLGKELVFPRRNKCGPSADPQLPLVHSPSPEPHHKEKPSPPSSHRSSDSNELHEQTPQRMLPPERQFSNPATPTLPRRRDPAQLGPASSSFSHPVRPTVHSSSTADTAQQRPLIITHTRHQSLLDQHNSSTNQQADIVDEHLLSHSLQPAAVNLGEDSEGEHAEILRGAAECLHAQDYSHMCRVLSDIRLDEVSDDIALAVTFGLGQALLKLKQLSQAVPYFSLLRDRARMMGADCRGEQSIASYYLGEISYARAKFDEATAHYRTALACHSSEVGVAKTFKLVPPSKAGLWSKLAGALRNGSKVVDAIAAYRQAISCATARKERLAAHTSLGNLLQNSGENSQAVEEYTAAIQLCEELGDNVSLGWAHGNIGNAYLGLGFRDKAIYHLKMALELTLKHEPTPVAIGRAYNNLGTAHQALNELDKAQEFYDLSLAQAIYGGDAAGQARVYGNIGNLQMILKNYDGSIAHYTETLNTTRDKGTKGTALHNRGCAWYEKAESAKRRHFSLVSSSSTVSSASPTETGKYYTLTYHGTEVERAVEEEHRLPDLPPTIARYYQRALEDLKYVVDQHEESFTHIKGSRKGLTLSVSLFETNSRTFHRLLDCHYNLGQWETALEYAEQSRARTLGELLLERKRGQLDMELKTPLDVGQIERIVGSQQLDVVVVSYTGSRLLVWVLSPGEFGEGVRVVRRAMFQVTLEEDEFDGKSLDYYLHYLLSEELVEKSVEMYAFSDYQSSAHVLPIVRLHALFAEPLLRVLSCLHPAPPGPGEVSDVIFIPDSYINLLPLAGLFNRASQQFLGDSYRFRIMPSLLSMGILGQMPQVEVHVARDRNKFCVVGNPSIPVFTVGGKTWSLGKLPFATEEAEWVSYILGCRATLHEQATRSVVMMMVAGARMIHIATHGSAVSGFLAFASLDSGGSSDPVDEKSVLIYPEDIEKMAMNPALVVLSSCDSGRGTVKADGVLGMARAFILAGAQAVMTTLWRVPDESAAVFMKFFYQYLVEGHPSSAALQKAMLSVRSFVKYSAFVHWSGYQLSGREVRVVMGGGDERERGVREAMGGEGPTVFPRLTVVQSLEQNLIEKAGDSSSPPTDVQVVHGSHGLSPAAPVRDFVLRHYSAFTGGVFWLNCSSQDLLTGALDLVNTVYRTDSAEQVLMVLDDLTSLPESDNLRSILKSRRTHIIAVSHSSQTPEHLKREIDQRLIRGCTPISVQPLSTVHTTQRIVHSVVSRTHFTPLNREQKLLAKVASLASGCPGLVAMTNSLLQRCLLETEEAPHGEFLDLFASKVNFTPERPVSVEVNSATGEVIPGSFRTDRYISELISAFELPPAHLFVLRTLSVFSPQPLPFSLVETIQFLVAKATQASIVPGGRGAPNSIANLLSTKLLRPYPSPIISPPIDNSSPEQSQPLENQTKYLYVPQLVQDTLWDNMDETDIVFTITTAYRALLELTSRPTLSASDLCYCTGLTETLIAKCDTSRTFISDAVYREVYKMLVGLKLRHSSSSSVSLI